MSSGLVARALSLLEMLSDKPAGMRLQEIADAAGLPKSGAHRLLAELADAGFVRQTPLGQYELTLKLAALGFRHVAATGITDLAQPILDRLAEQSEELVRLAVRDGDALIYTLKAQGARAGLRYDPDIGQIAPLFCTATGHAFLASFSDAEAIRRVEQQNLPMLTGFGPNAPRSAAALRRALAATRARGYAEVVETSAPGTAALAACMRGREGEILGVLSVAGPVQRLDAARRAALAPSLLAACEALEAASPASATLGGIRL